jgi:hypothetical protein
MAIRSVAVTNTLEEFRTTFNSLGTDVGDLGSLSTTDQSSIVAAINEVNTSVTTAFKIADDSSTQQTINTGDVFRISGTSNQVTATVSATDTLTVALASTISGITSLTATGTVQGGTLTDGTASLTSGALTGVTSATIGGITISGSQISSADSTLIQMEGLNILNVSSASTDTDAFLVSDGGVVKKRTGEEVLSDIGAASSGFAIAQAVALG